MHSTIGDGFSGKVAHRRTPTVNDFPIPSGHSFTVAKRDQGLVSPTQSSFTFSEEDQQPHAISTPCTMPSTPIIRDMDRGTPGEGGSRAPSVNGYAEQKELGRKRSQYFADSLACREPVMNFRDRVHKDSVIMADVKTNVIVRFPIFSLHRVILMIFSYARSETSSCSLASFPSTSPSATIARPHQSSSHWTTRPVSSSLGPSNPPISLLSPLSPLKSHLQPTNATQHSLNHLWQPRLECFPIAALSSSLA